MSGFSSAAPVWTAYTPTISAGTPTGFTTSLTLAEYLVVGKLVHVRFKFDITANGTGSGVVTIATPAGLAPKDSAAVGAGVDNTAGTMQQILIAGTDLWLLTNAGAYPGITGHTYTGSIAYAIA